MLPETTRKNRRAVMAELLLTGNPASIHTREDQVSLSIDFDTIADLRSWLHVAGLNGPDLLTGEHEGTNREGRPYRSMSAYPDLHGWELYANAIEYADAGKALEPATADQLAALAAA